MVNSRLRIILTLLIKGRLIRKNFFKEPQIEMKVFVRVLKNQLVLMLGR